MDSQKYPKENENIRICFVSVSVMFKIITVDLTRDRMQLSCKSIKLSVICSKSSLKSIFKTRILRLSTSLVTYLL